MPYDPDLDPVLASIEARMTAIEARLDDLEAGVVVTPPVDTTPVDPVENGVLIADPIFTSYTAATAASRDPSGYRETPEVGSIVDGNLRLTCLDDMLWPRANFEMSNLVPGTVYTVNVDHVGGNQYGYWVKVMNGEADNAEAVYYHADLYEDHSFEFTATQDIHWLQIMSGCGTVGRYRGFASLTVAEAEEVAEPVDPEPTPEPEPEPTPEPTPTPEPVPSEPIWRTLPRSQLSIPSSVNVPAGQNEIIIPVTVDHTDRESFYAYVSSFTNISNGGINVGNTAQQRQMYSNWENVLYRWSPKDDKTHYIRINMRDIAVAGRSVGVNIRVKGLGDLQKGRQVRVNFIEGAELPELVPQFHRPLRRLNLENAVRENEFDPETVQYSDSGFKDGIPVWRSRLSHGYSQDGNGETGLYMNEDRFPGIAQSPISYDAAEDALRLHTLAFPMDARPEFNSRLFRHQAVMIQGQTLDNVCGFEGVWRMVAKTSRRRYAWPAFWLAGRGSSGARGSWTAWPPEIDIMEQFNQAFGSDSPITGFTTTFAQHYGDVGSNNRIGSFGGDVEVDKWLGATGVAEDYHSYACSVVWEGNRGEVTFFFDDVEIGCGTLFARHQNMVTKEVFYPMMNVAVRAPSAYTPEQYNTDEGRGHSGDMLVRDMGYYSSGFTFDVPAA